MKIWMILIWALSFLMGYFVPYLWIKMRDNRYYKDWETADSEMRGRIEKLEGKSDFWRYWELTEEQKQAYRAAGIPKENYSRSMTYQNLLQQILDHLELDLTYEGPTEGGLKLGPKK
jgi:hypothetical protein